MLWLLLPVATLAQSTGGGALTDTTGRQTTPCITPAQRTEIQQRLQASQQKLGLVPTGEKVDHPLLIHPLRKAAHCRDYHPSSVWQFVDHNSAVGPFSYNAGGATNRDYTCGNRTYDNANGYNHSGTDFGLWPFGWYKMDQNMVEVVAAAPGVILVKDDNNPDRSCNGAVQSTNWNAVYVQHDDGSVAWYGHLKRGSLTFKSVGSRVEAGEYLGLVGSSGFSTAPHLHLEMYSATNELVDPYGGTCNAQNGSDSWWQQQEAYLEKQVNAITLHRNQPNLANTCPAVDAENPNELVTVAADGTSFYVYVWGRNLELNERVTTALYRPDGSQYSNLTYLSNFAASSFYSYYVHTIASGEALGPWQARITYGGQTYTRTFWVTGLEADLSLQMQSSALTAPLNGPVEYELILRNDGTLTANNILTRAYLPPNLTFVDSPDGSMSASGSVVSGNTLTLGAGSSRIMRFRARPRVAGAYLTTAQVVQASVQDVDSQANSGTRDGQDDMSSVLIRTTTDGSNLFVAHAPNSSTGFAVESNQPPVDPRRADLALTLLPDRRTVAVNEEIEIRLVVRHQGGTKAENVMVQCTLPPGLTYAGGLSAEGNVVTGTVPGLYAGEEMILTFRATVTTTGRFPLIAQISSCSQTDPDSTPNNGTANGEDDTAMAEVFGGY